MREILFRGKLVDDGMLVEGSLIQTLVEESRENNVVKDRPACFIRFFDESLCYEVEKDTVVQYTGLTDKNGTMIFEGDKVRGLFLFGMPIIGVCDFQNGAFGLKWMRGDIEEFTPFCCTHGVEWEVVDDE